MPCPFKLVICTSVLCLAVVAYWLHYHFSETTLDYILQFVPLPEHYKDRLYDFLLGEGCEPSQSITTTSSSSPSTTCSTTNPTAIAPPEGSTMMKNNNNNNNNDTNTNNDDEQQEQEQPTRRTQLPTQQQSQREPSTSSSPSTRKRKQHNFQRHEIPKIIKVFKYIMMAVIVYMHVEIFYYYFTEKCFAAQMVRNIDYYTGLEIVKALKATSHQTLSTSGH